MLLKRVDQHRVGPDVRRPLRQRERRGRPGLARSGRHEDRSLPLEVAVDKVPVASAAVTYTVGGKQYVSVEVGGAGHSNVTRPLDLTNPAGLRGDDIYTFVLP